MGDDISYYEDIGYTAIVEDVAGGTVRVPAGYSQDRQVLTIQGIPGNQPQGNRKINHTNDGHLRIDIVIFQNEASCWVVLDFDDPMRHVTRQE